MKFRRFKYTEGGVISLANILFGSLKALLNKMHEV